DKHSVETIKKLLEAAKPREFKEPVEVAVNLREVGLSVPKNRVVEEVVLPKGRGKPIRVCVFASGELALKARAVADLVIQPQEIEEYASDKRKARALAAAYDFFIAEAPLMPVIGKRLGVVLGPRGRMPRPLPPTADPTNLINSMRNTVRARRRASSASRISTGSPRPSSRRFARSCPGAPRSRSPRTISYVSHSSKRAQRSRNSSS